MQSTNTATRFYAGNAGTRRPNRNDVNGACNVRRLRRCKVPEIAKDLLLGRCCWVCGRYFQHPHKENAPYEHGVSVLCWDCWDEVSKSRLQKQNRRLQRAQVATV